MIDRRSGTQGCRRRASIAARRSSPFPDASSIHLFNSEIVSETAFPMLPSAFTANTTVCNVFHLDVPLFSSPEFHLYSLPSCHIFRESSLSIFRQSLECRYFVHNSRCADRKSEQERKCRVILTNIPIHRHNLYRPFAGAESIMREMTGNNAASGR